MGLGRFSPLALRASMVSTGDGTVVVLLGKGMPLDLPSSLKGDFDTRPPSITCFQLLEFRRTSEMRGAGAVSDVGESRFEIRRGVVDGDRQPSFVVSECRGVSELIARDDERDVGDGEQR